MEGGEAKESKAAANEAIVGSPVQSNDEAGVGRSFDCTFCKRGFSNAQALGGHMNIHRKERARVRPDPIPSASEASWYYAAYPRRHRPFHPTASDLLKNFTVYFPDSVPVNLDIRASYDHMHQKRPPRELSLFGDDGLLGSSKIVDGDRVEGGEEKKRDKEEGGLDLELRLGHIQ